MEAIDTTGTFLFATPALLACAFLIRREYQLLKEQKSLETSTLKQLEKLYFCQLGLAACGIFSLFDLAEWTNLIVLLECVVSMFGFLQYRRAKYEIAPQLNFHYAIPRGFTVVLLLILSTLAAAFRLDVLNGSLLVYLALLVAVAAMSACAIGMASRFWIHSRTFAVSCVVVALVATSGLFGLADPVLLRIRFALTKPYYEYRLRTLLQTKASEGGFLWFARYESGPPERAAFCIVNLGHGSWSGQVYDPTGEVMLINSMNFENMYEARFYPVREYFGGTMASAQPVGANWYVCSFF